jgi:hypothetical protein
LHCEKYTATLVCITYRYTWKGKNYICDQPVWRGDSERGNMLTLVRLLPANPAISSIFGDGFRSAEWMQRTILGLILSLAGLCVLIGSLLNLFAAGHP